MKNLTRMLSRRSVRLLPILTASIVTVSVPLAHAALETWNNFTGTSNWSLGTNWLDGSAPLANDPTLELLFGATGAQAYTANNDIANLQLNSLTLNSSSTGTISLTGNPLDFRLDGVDAPAVTQSGTGPASISNGLIATDPLTFTGAGAGLVSLTGAISGAGSLT